MATRIDIVSDTHGHLSAELRAAIAGCDVLVHAGDITSEADWAELNLSAPVVHAVLGNNDFYYDYEPELDQTASFVCDGVRVGVAHYREEIPHGVQLAVCGHTHRAVVDWRGDGVLVNPGSASYPRGMRGPTIARVMVESGRVVSAEIIDL